MKRIFMMALIMIAIQFAKAQTSNITGTVKDDKGNALQHVFISDDQYKTASFSDSTGNFTIAVHPDSKLKFSLAGYDAASVAIDKNNTSPQVALKSNGTGGGANTITAQATAQKNGNEAESTYGSGGVITPVHQKGNTHGNRYLFDTFVQGYIISANGELIHGAIDMYDYDKMDGSLLLSNDNKTMSQISWDNVKSFSLFSRQNERYDFEKAPGIDPSHYVQVLASGLKYKIYKLIKTRFVKSDYVNTGVASRGNDYDEFIDDADYYIFDVQANQPKKISLKKKSLKDAFAKDADKVNKYLSDNSGDINDAYLAKLGDFMNQ